MRRIDRVKFWSWLTYYNACEPAMDYTWRYLVSGATVKELIRECPNGEWLLWLADRLDLTRKRDCGLEDVYCRPISLAKQVRKKFTWGDFRDAMLKKGLGL